MMFSQAVVTGGAGFVGSNLCKALSKAGVEVVSIDNYSNGSEKNHVEGVEYIFADVKDLPSMVSDDGLMVLPESGKSISPDIVFHLAEFCRAEQSVPLPTRTMMTTYHTIPCVVDFCHKTGAKLMYAGSSTKYGDGESPYASCKKLNTMFVKDMCNQLGIPFAITYFYNVYGENEPDTGLFAMLIAKALRAKRLGETITVTSPGTQKRFFTNVNDIINGLLVVAERGHGDEYGIGADEEYSVLEVMEMVGCKYVMGPPKPGNRMGSQLMSQKTKRLGWSPSVRLPDYIASKAAEAEAVFADREVSQHGTETPHKATA